MLEKTFETKDTVIREVFRDGYLFEMPPHQRPYAWTTNETDQLLEDLMLAALNGTKEEAYFLGSIVLVKRGDSIAHQIIDGQQRLTTLTILFCVLRELAQDASAKDSLDNLVREKGDIFAGSKDRYRLSVRERDKDFFRYNIQEEDRLANFVKQTAVPDTDSRQRFHENAKLLWNRLSSETQERRDALSAFIVQKCHLIMVTASDNISAHRIFSVLNARGLNLDATDILKAEILDYVPTSRQDEYTRKWEDIEDDLGRDEFRNLFAHLYVIYNKNRYHRELAEAFRRDVLAEHEISGMPFIDKVLIPYAADYEVVANAAYDGARDADAVNMYLRQLGWLDNEDWIPPVMAFFHRNGNHEAALLRFLKEFDRLAYSLFILRFRRDPRIGRYSRTLNAIENGDDLFADNGPLDLIPQEKRDILRALDGTIYQKQTRRFTAPLLARLSNAIADPPISEFAKVTVEHVLPQNPPSGSEWLASFKDTEEREDWTNRLANLVLLSHKKNASAQNFDFTRKKDEYFKRGGIPSFALTTQVIGKNEWNPKILERRQRYLIDVLKREWRLG